MRNLWKGLFIIGVAGSLVGLTVLAQRGSRERKKAGRKVRSNLVKTVKVGLPVAKVVHTGRALLTRSSR